MLSLFKLLDQEEDNKRYRHTQKHQQGPQLIAPFLRFLWEVTLETTGSFERHYLLIYSNIGFRDHNFKELFSDVVNKWLNLVTPIVSFTVTIRDQIVDIIMKQLHNPGKSIYSHRVCNDVNSGVILPIHSSVWQPYRIPMYRPFLISSTVISSISILLLLIDLDVAYN